MALQDWIALAQGHAGAALLLSLVDSGEADAAGDDAVRLTHGRTAALSQAEARRLELPPSCALTLFLSHDAPLSEPTFRLDLDWLRTDGQRLFGVQRLGTRLQSGSQCWLALDPLYSALEAIDRVNAASGDTSSAGLDRRMAAYAELKSALVRMTGDLRVDDYLRGLTIHCATGLGIDLEPGTDKAPFLPTLYGSRPEPTAAPGDDTGADDGEPTHRREPLLPNLHAKTFQKRFLAQGARSHNRLGTGVYTVLDAPAAAALQVVAQVNAADAETRGQFRVDPMAFLTPAIEAAGGAGEILCALRGYGDRVTGTGDWVRPGFSFPLPVTRDWFPAEEVETFQVALPEGALLVVRADQVAELRDLITKAQEAGDGAIDFAGLESA
ncbi:hypothetical protein [Thiococcus pfennigii]|uniref:hypothetical protein n=1 Tax=Thiococcus pfennigii TaxID=1057 RepID=UPI001905D62C|nr:hypothetical protein [Thiococcus pfennigii]